MEGSAVLDWTNFCYDFYANNQLKERMVGLAGTDDYETIIYNWEMLWFVSYATVHGGKFSGTTVLVVTDNDNMAIALEKGRSDNRCCNYLIKILRLLQATYHFDVRAVYIWTHHNLLADTISRVFDDASKMGLEAEDVERYMAENYPKFTRTPLLDVAKHYLQREWVDRALELPIPGQPSALARELAGVRAEVCKAAASTALVKPSRQPPCVCDFFSGQGSFSTVWANELGYACVGRCELDDGMDWLFAQRVPCLNRCYDFYDDEWESWAVYRPRMAAFSASCQPWSFANRNPMGFADANGRGWHIYDCACRLFDRLPTLEVVILENVEGLLTLDEGFAVEHIRQSLAVRGLVLHLSSANAMNFGTPQARRRLMGLIERQKHAARLPALPELKWAEAAAGRLDAWLDPLDRVPGVVIVAVPGQRYVPHEPDVGRGPSAPVRVGMLHLPGGEEAPAYVGALVRFGSSKKFWRVLRVYPDGNLRLFRAGEPHKLNKAPEEIEYVLPQAVPVHSIRGAAAPVKAWGEPLAGPGTVLYCDDRGASALIRGLSFRECWRVQGKCLGLLDEWRENHTAGVPGTPVFTAAAAYRAAGLSIPQGLAESTAKWGAARLEQILELEEQDGLHLIDDAPGEPRASRK